MRKQFEIVVCINRRLSGSQPCCASRGGEAIASELERQLEEYGFTGCVRRVECLGQCAKGANLRLAPGKGFYHGVTMEDLDAVKREFLRLAHSQQN